MTDARSGGREEGPLEEFLGASESFVRNVCSAQVESAGDDPDAVLLEGMSRIAIAQFGRVCEEIRASYRACNGAARRDADAVLAIQEGALMARVGEEIALAAIAKGPGGGFFGWLSEHIDLIKKIMDMIIRITHGGAYPPWWEKIRELVDELIRAILALFAGMKGFNRQEVANEMSARAVNTMNELAALARLIAANRQQSTENGH